jgi:hypothetical protein
MPIRSRARNRDWSASLQTAKANMPLKRLTQSSPQAWKALRMTSLSPSEKKR